VGWLTKRAKDLDDGIQAQYKRTKTKKCPVCNGKGMVYNSSKKRWDTCSTCEGNCTVNA